MTWLVLLQFDPIHTIERVGLSKMLVDWASCFCSVKEVKEDKSKTSIMAVDIQKESGFTAKADACQTPAKQKRDDCEL